MFIDLFSVLGFENQSVFSRAVEISNHNEFVWFYPLVGFIHKSIDNQLLTLSNNDLMLLLLVNLQNVYLHWLQGVLKSVGRLKGLILRSQLIVLLRNKCFNETPPSTSEELRRKLRMFRDAYANNQHVEVIIPPIFNTANEMYPIFIWKVKTNKCYALIKVKTITSQIN